jgi:ATP-dependent DNA helicase RecG
MKARGMDSKGLRLILKNLLTQIGDKIPENLPTTLVQQYELMPRFMAFREIHFPTTQDNVNKALGRLKLEELFFIQLKILQSKIGLQQQVSGFVFNEVGDNFNKFYKECLPFELTDAQKRVLKEIRKDTSTGVHMNRLVQGDVGSGKTIVALMSMLLGIDNGFQTALMAPTEILANQHFIGIKELVEPLGIKVMLLTGSVKKKARVLIHEALEDGSCDILIGTHALIEEVVKFKNLGIAIIDEQHRFGVAQRSKLWKKNYKPPHVLVMTATPIPRTLAMTVYGDLDVSVIDELPPGRKPIVTKHFTDSQRLAVLGFMKEQISKGRQVYVVYPLIEESESMDYKDLMDGYESMARYFPIPEYQLSIVHGRMKPEDKDFEMKRFSEGQTQIMVATTVIEVGVNVPNASVMVIESAERFGLSQLHQLRGRVGRGSEQSFCVLMTGNKLSKEAKIRMQTMVGTNDGFKISEVDLKLRGPGDLQGTQQSGVLDLKLASLVEDSKLLSFARNRVKELLTDDLKLEKPENYPVKLHLLLQESNHKVNWGRIS